MFSKFGTVKSEDTPLLEDISGKSKMGGVVPMFFNNFDCLFLRVLSYFDISNVKL